LDGAAKAKYDNPGFKLFASMQGATPSSRLARLGTVLGAQEIFPVVDSEGKRVFLFDSGPQECYFGLKFGPK
jgi:hypothetical protein